MINVTNMCHIHDQCVFCDKILELGKKNEKKRLIFFYFAILEIKIIKLVTSRRRHFLGHHL
jgi:hypothetical protein